MIKNALVITKVPTYFVDQTQTTCQLGSTIVTTTTTTTTTTKIDTNVSISFFHKYLSLFFRCCLLVPAMMAMKWFSLFFFLLVSSGCRLFSLQADSSVSSLLGLDCRRFILPHISGRSLSLFPLRCGLQADLTAPYFRQVCQLFPVHSL